MRPRRTGIALMSTAVVLAFAWQASADDVGRSLVPAGGASPTSLNVVDGNLRTEVPLIKWYARGGSAVSLSLFHNAKGGSVDALMPRPPSSAMEATVGEGGSCTPGWHKLACAFVNHESGVESTLSPPVNVLFEYKWTLVGESSELLPFYKATLTVPAVPLASNLDVVVYMTRSGGNQLFGPVAKVAAAARRDLTIEAFDDEKLVKPYRDARLRLRDRDPVDFGQGWGHSFGTKVVSASTNDTRIRTGSGDETPCAAVAEGQPAQLTLKEDDTWTLAGPHRTLSTFDAAGLLTSWADGAGNVVTVKRRADGSVESVVDPTNRSIELVYGENGRVARIRDPLGRSWRFSYDDDGNLVQIDYPELAGRTHSRRFTYGPGHTIASESFAGRVWRFDYDESRRLTAWRNPLGAAWTVGYDRDAGTTTLKAPLGQQTIYTVSQNRVASVQDEAGYSEQYSYDDDGNVVSLLDRNGNAWEATFDRRGNRLTATNPLGATRSWTYDAGDDVLTSTDALDHTMAYAYNAQGRTTSWKDALGRTRTASYDAYGQRTSLTDASGRTTRFEYDDDGNTSSIVRPSGARTSFKHDRLGRIASFTDAAGGEATFEYDAWQRQTRETRADGSTMSFAYDLDGRLVGRTDGLGRKTGQSFDAAGRMVRRTNPDRSFETYEYDENDRLARITNARGHARTIKWSDRGEVTELALPDESVERWRYTKTGKVASRANGAGEELGFSYDEADQLTAIVHPGPEGATTFAYDPAGRLTGMTDASGKTEQTYDAAGQVRRLVTPQGTTELTYTDAGEPATRTEVGVGDTTFGYDSAGRLSVVLNPRGEATRFAYDDADRPIRKTFANGVHEETEYDELSRRAADRVENAQGELLRSHRYSYDAASNLRSSTVNGMETSYAYDSRDQLTSESGPGATTSYTYDANGNRLTATADGVTETYTYDPGDKLTRIVAPDGIKTFDYDLAGRTIGVTRGSEKTAFSYDSESRVVKIAYPDGRVSTFSYNGAGARVGRVDSRESVSYRRAGASVLSPVLGDGSANVTPGISENRDGATRFHHGGFKNLDAQTGASGEIVATREYSAFGKVLPSSAGEFAGSSGYGGRFGYRTDRDGGLMLLGHRDYDPSTGRFLTRDPIHVGGNWYAYCGNNPLTRADPSGLRWDWDIIMVVSRWLIANGNANEEIGEQIAKVLAGLGITPTRALVQEVWQTMTALMNRQLAQQAVVEASTFLGLELGASVLAVSAVALLDVALIAGVAYEAYVIFGGPPGRPEMPVGQGPYGLIDKVFDTFNPNSKPIPGMQDGIPRNPRWVPPPRLLAHATDE